MRQSVCVSALIRDTVKIKTGNLTKNWRFPVGWSRRDSNPRPNNRPVGLLHVYSLLVCRKREGQRQPDPILILLDFRLRVETPLSLFLPDDASFTAL